MVKGRMFAAAMSGLVLFGACSGAGDGETGSGAEPAGDKVKPDGVVMVSKALTLTPEKGLNPTVAVDAKSGAVFLSWAEEVEPAPGASGGEAEAATWRAVVARSDDGGATFGPPVVASAAGHRVATSTVSPTRVAVGPEGEVYVLYGRDVPDADPDLYEAGQTSPWVARSEDRGQSFGAPVEVAPAESANTTMGGSNLFVASDGDLYVSWLDERERIVHELATRGQPAPSGHSHEEAPPTQLRIARSSDGGRSFEPSVLAQQPVSASVGTQMAQGADGPLFISTRSEETRLKASYDAVRDMFVSTSTDDGRTWSTAKKVHDDGFKISSSPENTSGLVVDANGRLHAAWYTGTEGGAGPGVYYAVSDDGGSTFATPVGLLRDTWVPYSDVKLAVDADGQAWVAFEDRRGDEDQVVVARLDSAGRLELSKAGPGIAPDIATVGGKALLTWSPASSPAGEDAHNLSGGIFALLASPSGKG